MRDRSSSSRPASALRLVVVSLEPWDEVWRRNQYLVDGLLRADPAAQVLFVEPPTDPTFELLGGRVPRRAAGLRRAEGYEGRLRLFQPAKLLPRRFGTAADSMLADSVRRAVHRLGWSSGVLWINDPGGARLLDRLDWPSLYDITDDWVLADRGPREHARLAAADGELVRRCREVVVCSPELQRTRGAHRAVHLIPNAVDVARYRRAAPRPTDLPPGQIALYAGTLHEDRLDVDLVLETADALAAGADGQARLVLVGPDALNERNSARLRAHPRVEVLGARPRDTVPGYLQHADALIVPHLVDEFTETLDPIKLYEYFAVGRPVVSTSVAGFREERASAGVVVDDGAGFASAVVAALRSPAPTVERAGVADWSDRVTAMTEVVAALAASTSETPR